MEKIDAGFFTRHPVDCARDLIGCTFHWYGCVGRIVETEAYAAEGDPACHTFFRPGARRFVASHEAGDAYVYLNYGVHWLFNILARGGGMDGFVLFRALEPVGGLEGMRKRRPGVKDRELCSGPGKLTKALGIDGSHHATTFLDDPECSIFRGPVKHRVEGPRIGISAAIDLPWRFGDPNSTSLSRKF
ncbi:DNA-3-methyladenine glycosylase [Luteolibacter ambystomatis]|uniref:Putative 3-methyladenine DNA glycosylase n=1 Tax=Luteolibacter ambystomatis TaxID=2824561 RepID=A0A975G745_9BACT|nr:DNA-3-methyladenine glycosylase [Luteolibacter ambystomatis]QUE50178.1 DNA-3-methyladenine glycosylase [Luteolibacter ambystomatis]